MTFEWHQCLKCIKKGTCVILQVSYRNNLDLFSDVEIEVMNQESAAQQFVSV